MASPAGREPIWDVFLSYNRADKDSVVAIQRQLAARGVKTFLDRQQLAAGLSWPDALEHGLQSSRAVAVFLGRAGVGLWQKREIAFALDRQVEFERAGNVYPVIPLLLDGAEIAAGFLFLNTWIDFRDVLSTEEALEALVVALRTGGSAVQASGAADLCPYRALLPFTEADAAFYFGRELSVRDLAQKVLRTNLNLVAVIGASGSGKSSLVSAGLLPLLRKERPPERTWDTVWFTPGERPWRRLADALVELLDPDLSEAEKVRSAGILAEECAGGTGGFQSVVQRVLTKSNGTQRLLVVVDQFEELLTLAPESVRRPFIDTLLESDSAPLTVVLTLRADFFNAATGVSRILTDKIAAGQVILGPPHAQEVRDSIQKPAKLVGLTFEAGLVDRIVDDMAGKPGSLPLLEYALTELWKNRAGTRLTHDAYVTAGGVARAIATRAESVYEQLKPHDKVIAERLFTRLVRVTAGDDEGAGADTRYRAGRAEVGDAGWSIAQRFADPQVRLLITSVDATTREEEVEVSHEALIRGWTRLRDWIASNREFLVWRQDLRYELSRWERTGRNEAALLRGDLLDRAREWLDRRGDDLNELERTFILWTTADDYQLKKVIDDASRRLRFVDGTLLAEWLVVRVAGGDEAVIESDDGKRAGSHLHVKLAHLFDRAGVRPRALEFARRIAVADQRAVALAALLESTPADDHDNLLTLAREIVEAVPIDEQQRSPVLKRVGMTLVERHAGPQLLALLRPDRRISLLSEIVGALLQRGQSEAALSFARALEDPTERAHALTAAAVMLNDGDVSREAFVATNHLARDAEEVRARALWRVAETAGVGPALELAAQIALPGHRVRLLGQMVPKLSASKESPHTAAFRASVAAALSSVTAPYERELERNRVIEALCQAGMLEDALGLARQASADNRPSALLMVARTFVELENRDQAIRVTRESLAAALGIVDNYRWSELLNEVLALVLELEGAGPAIDAASAIANLDDRAKYLTVVFTCCAGHGSPEDANGAALAAWTAARNVERGGRRDVAIDRVIHAMVAQGRTSQVMEFCRDMPPSGDLNRWLIPLVSALRDAERRGEASALLDDAASAIARGEVSPREHTSAIGNLAMAYVELGESRTFLARFGELDSIVIAASAARMARNGHFDAAAELAAKVTDDSRGALWNTIVRAAAMDYTGSRAVDLARQAVAVLRGIDLPDGVFAVLSDAGELALLHTASLAISVPRHRCLLLARVSSLLSSSGHVTEGLAAAHEAVAAFQSVDGDDGTLLGATADALLQARDPGSVLALVADYAPHANGRSVWDKVSEAFTHRSRNATPPTPQAAAEIVRAIPAEGARNKVLSRLIVACAALGDTALAAELSRGLSDPEARARVALETLPLLESPAAMIDSIRTTAWTEPNAIRQFAERLTALQGRFSLEERRQILNALREAASPPATSDQGGLDQASITLIEAFACSGLLAESMSMALAAKTPIGQAKMLAKVLAAARDVSAEARIDAARQALDAALTVEDGYRRDQLCAAIFAALARSVSAAPVIELSKRVATTEARVSCLTAAIGSFGARGDGASGAAAAREAILLVSSTDKGYAHRRIVGSVAGAMAAAGLVDAAVDLARSLEADERAAALIEMVRPPSASARRSELAHEAARAAFELEPGYSRGSALEDLAAALTEGGASDLAIDIASEEGAAAHRALMLAAIVETRARREAEAAAAVASEALTAARDLDNQWERRRIQSKIVSVFATERPRLATRLASQIVNESDRGDVLGEVSRRLLGDGRMGEVLLILSEIDSAEARVRTLLECTRHFLSLGLRRRARALAGEMLTATHQLGARDERRSATTELLRALWNGRMPQFARELANSVGVAARRAEVLDSLAELLCEQNMLDEGLTLVRGIKSHADAYEAPTALARAMIKSGRLNDAAEVGLLIAGDSYLRSQTLLTIIQECVKAGSYALASDVARAMGNEEAEQLANIASAMANSGDVDGAVRLARSITTAIQQARAFATIARAAVSRGAIDQAEEALAQAIAISESIADYDEHARAAARIAAAQAGLTRFEQARVTAERCHLAKERIWADTAILRSYIASGRPELAVPLTGVITAEI